MCQTDSELDSFLANRKRSVGEDEPFESLAELGAIWNCLLHAKLPNSNINSCRRKIEDELSSISYDKGALDRSLQQRIDSLQRIVGIGAKFEFEELVVVISRRIEIDLLLDLPQKILRVDEETLAGIDEDIQSISSAMINRTEFKLAQAAVSKNWGSPITHRLLVQ